MYLKIGGTIPCRESLIFIIYLHKFNTIQFGDLVRADLLYLIALTFLDGVGPISAKNLIAHCGSAKAVFRTKKGRLLKVPGIGQRTAKGIQPNEALKQAENELRFIQKQKLTAITYLDKNFPKRLHHCADSPIVIYSKGQADWNTPRSIAIVGTRKATPYGKDFVNEFIEEIAVYKPIIISGLAFGIDAAAHRAALKNDLQTVGVLGHALDKLYPAQHRALSYEMIDRGALVSEFVSDTRFDKENFPKRNRIIAGMADATIVVETGMSGGSIISAHLAASYNRDVFAVPGNRQKKFSQGCNGLIKKNVAALIENADDFVDAMGWEKSGKTAAVQKKLFLDLSAEQLKVLAAFNGKDEIAVEELAGVSKMSSGTLAVHLLELEMLGVLQTRPGNKIRKV